MMDKRYERILKEYEISYYEYWNGNRQVYDISGFLVHFECPADRFPEMFIQYCLAYNEDEGLEKEIRERNIAPADLISLEADYRETEGALSALARRFIVTEWEVEIETLHVMNRTVLYLLSEANAFVSQDQEGLHICSYTEFGSKYQISCRDADHLLEDVRKACRSYDQQRYFMDQMEKIEKGERVRIPTAQLIQESEMVQSFLEELLQGMEELVREGEEMDG